MNGCRLFHRATLILALIGAPVAVFSAGAIQGTPCAPRSVAPGATRFTQLPSERTGVNCANPYDDPRMWGDRYKMFMLGPIGTGVAIADYDGDGRPDIFVTNKCAPNRLYRNLGDFRFEDVTEQAGVGGPVGAWKGGVAFVDVNNDGRPDLYVCRWNAPNLLYLNQGDGRFVEGAAAAGLDVTDSSVMGAFCDYDRDGFLDLFLQTNLLNPDEHPDGQRDRLFHNRGDGTFEEVTDKAGLFGETHGHSATWWDYDGDGWPDLYVANDFSPRDQLYRNNHDGTFSDVLASVVPHTPIYAMGSDVGDVNNDGLMDLFVADMAPTDSRRDRRTMLELRERFPDLPTLDWPTQYVRNALYLNTGTGRCQEAAILAGIAATDWTWAVRFEDLDNDGWQDLYVTNGMVRDLFDNDRTLKLAGFSVPEQARAVKTWPILNERNQVYRNGGDLAFTEVGAAWGLNQIGISFGASFGDLDGDGDLDLVFTNYENLPTVCRNDGVDGHSIEVKLRGTASNRFGVGATVRIETPDGSRQMRQLVLARGYMSTSEPMLHFGIGKETKVSALLVAWPSGATQRFTNLAGDTAYTISEPSTEGIRLTDTSEPTPTGLFEESGERIGLNFVSKEAESVDELKDQPLLPFRQNSLGPPVAIADINGDGHDDVVVGGATGEAARLCLSQGDGTFATPVSSSRTVGAADAGVVVFDFNGDGHNDLFFSKGGAAFPAGDAAYQPRLFLGKGAMRFQRAPENALPVLTESVGPVVVADFDHDGRLDMFLGARTVVGAYGRVPRSALWLNEGGKLVDVTDTCARGLAGAGMISGALATDIDDDGWIDLLLAPQWGSIQYWHNDSGKGFEDWSERAGFSQAGSGWWNSLAAADFNGDGRLDYVVGNAGLNTPYRASPAAPALLLRGDFEGNGKTQLLEAELENGEFVPRRGRTKLISTFSSLARKLRSFETYGDATLTGMFGGDALREAAKLQATEFRSGVFLSRPEGKYHFEPLPRIAQIAPIFGVVAGDFDGDGNADICAVQNSYAPIPQTGRFDGGVGQMLRGDGHGHFVAVPPRESRLVVSGDGKGLAVVDSNTDGRPDLVASSHQGRVQVFINQGTKSGHFFSVILEGEKQNLRGVGARVFVLMADGRWQVSEVHAGDSYLSQSSATCFFGYTEANPPREIRVRWASGELRQAWTGGRAVMRIPLKIDP